MAAGATEDDRRLVLAAVPVFLAIALVFSNIETLEWMNRVMQHSLRARTLAEQLYPVLVKQQYAPPKKRREISALSDVDAAGQGALTKQRGFNTVSPDDELELKRSARGGGGSRNESREYAGQGLRPERRGGDSDGTGGQSTGRFRIPANYRFQEELRLNFQGAGEVSLPRKRFPEFSYFQAMIRSIRSNWAPPGANVIYQDAYGYTVQQSIKPQMVRVLFLLDAEGNVRDVRVVGTVMQQTVAQSCVMALEGRNFGPPPKAVLDQGGIIGINFVFPPLRLR